MLCHQPRPKAAHEFHLQKYKDNSTPQNLLAHFKKKVSY